MVDLVALHKSTSDLVSGCMHNRTHTLPALQALLLEVTKKQMYGASITSCRPGLMLKCWPLYKLVVQVLPVAGLMLTCG